MSKAYAREAMKMAKTFTQENIFKRILWLYGLRTLISNIFLLAGYHLLPEGIFKGAFPLATMVAEQPNFWLHFGLTLIINFCFIAIGVGMNLFMYKEGIPFGYGILIATGIFSGLILGSNSFMDDLSRYSLLEGLVRGYSIGELEMLAYVFIIASTAGISIYMDTTPWYSLKTKMVKVKNFRDIRLSRKEWIVLLMGMFLIIIAGYNETVLWFTEVIG